MLLSMFISFLLARRFRGRTYVLLLTPIILLISFFSAGWVARAHIPRDIVVHTNSFFPAFLSILHFHPCDTSIMAHIQVRIVFSGITDRQFYPPSKSGHPDSFPLILLVSQHCKCNIGLLDKQNNIYTETEKTFTFELYCVFSRNVCYHDAYLN